MGASGALQATRVWPALYMLQGKIMASNLRSEQFPELISKQAWEDNTKAPGRFSLSRDERDARKAILDIAKLLHDYERHKSKNKWPDAIATFKDIDGKLRLVEHLEDPNQRGQQPCYKMLRAALIMGERDINARAAEIQNISRDTEPSQDPSQPPSYPAVRALTASREEPSRAAAGQTQQRSFRSTDVGSDDEGRSGHSRPLGR